MTFEGPPALGDRLLAGERHGGTHGLGADDETPPPIRLLGSLTLASAITGLTGNGNITDAVLTVRTYGGTLRVEFNATRFTYIDIAASAAAQDTFVNYDLDIDGVDAAVHRDEGVLVDTSNAELQRLESQFASPLVFIIEDLAPGSHLIQVKYAINDGDCTLDINGPIFLRIYEEYWP